MCLSAAVQAQGSTPVQGTQSPEATFRGGIEAVGITVTIRDSRGKVVRDLAAGDFEVFDSGSLTPITDFFSGEAPISLAILMDISGSMAAAIPAMVAVGCTPTELPKATDPIPDAETPTALAATATAAGTVAPTSKPPTEPQSPLSVAADSIDVLRQVGRRVVIEPERGTGNDHDHSGGHLSEDGRTEVLVRQADDGVVEYTSSHLDNIDSELVVDAYHHTIHAHPLTVLEVRRVLLEHLSELETFAAGPGGPNHTARTPIGPQPPPR